MSSRYPSISSPGDLPLPNTPRGQYKIHQSMKSSWKSLINLSKSPTSLKGVIRAGQCDDHAQSILKLSLDDDLVLSSKNVTEKRMNDDSEHIIQTLESNVPNDGSFNFPKEIKEDEVEKDE